MKDKKRRSLMKAATWRISATIITTIIIYALTGEVLLAIKGGALEIILKICFYFVHERTWETINWGRSNERA